MYSVKPFAQTMYGSGAKAGGGGNGPSDVISVPPGSGGWEGRAIATHKLCLVEFSAFMEQQRDPDIV